MKRVFNGILTQGQFKTSEVQLLLEIVGGVQRQAVGQVYLTDELLSALLNPELKPMFTFSCNDGLSFEVFVTNANSGSRTAKVVSSGKISGFLE